MNSVAIHWSAADICLGSFSDLVARGCEVPPYLDELTHTKGMALIASVIRSLVSLAALAHALARRPHKKQSVRGLRKNDAR